MNVPGPWRPSLADTDNWYETPKPVPFLPTARVMTIDPDPQDCQAFWRAAEAAELHETLFDADRRLAGYAWYDALPRVNRIDFAINHNGTTHTLESLREFQTDDIPNTGPGPFNYPLLRRSLVVRFSQALTASSPSL